MELLHKALDFQVRQVGNPEDRVLEFIGSTADADRCGDIIEVEGWDLKHYQKNPQFLWAHNYSVPPVGTTRKVAKTDKGLLFQVYFYTDEEINAKGWPANVPTPETVYRLYQVGGLKATSVGFQGLETEAILGDADEQGYRPRTGTRFKKQDLYELSAVPVPANPYALIQQAVQKGIIPEEQARFFKSPEPFSLGDLDQKLVKLGLEPAEGAEKNLRLLCGMVEALQEEVSKYPDHHFNLTLSDEQTIQLQAAIEGTLTKAGAVLSTKNKTALKNAQAMIQQVLDSAASEDEGKGAVPVKIEEVSIYSLALNPGEEPHGGRQAGESEEAEAEIEELRTLTQNLHLTVCKS